MRIMNKRKSCKERICALLLALALVLTGIMPGSAVTAEAAETAEVVFSIQDVENSIQPLKEGITITIFDADKAKVAEVTAPEDDGTYKISGLTADEEYTYEVVKSGYEYNNANAAKTFTPTEAGPNTVEVEMKMSEIALSQTGPLTMEVGAQEKVSVSNEVSELTYSWTVSSGSEYVEVSADGNITAKAGGPAGDDADKAAVVQATNGEKTAEIQVTVQKKSFNLGLSAEPGEGVDKKQITLTASGVPDDASGKLTFKIDGTEEKEIEAKTGHSVTYEDIDIIGTKSFTVEYSGDTTYKKASASTSGAYTKTQELTIDGESKKEVKYGDERWNEEFTISFGDTLKGRTLSTTVGFIDDPANSGTADDVADITVDEVEGKIKVTPENAGKIKITITAAKGNTNYETDTAEYTLTVNREDISLSDIDWRETPGKVYDGTTAFTLQGTVKGTDEKITIKANTVGKDVVTESDDKTKAVAQDVKIDAGTYYTTVESGTANRQLVVDDTDNIVSGVAVITHRPVYLTAQGIKISLMYGQNLKTGVESQQVYSKLLNDKGSRDGEIDSGVVGDEKLSSLPGLTITGEDTRLSVGRSHVVLIPNITDKISGNYELRFDETAENVKGTLEVTQQIIDKEDLLSSIYLNDSANLYDIVSEGSLDEIYASIGSVDEDGNKKEAPELKLGLKGSLADYYDQIMISFGGEAVNAAGENGISLSELETLVTEETDKQAVSDVKIYLARKDAPSTFTNTVKVSEWLYIDNKAPVAEITGYTPTAYSKLANALTFGMFTNKLYTATIEITDEGSRLSETTSQQYCVYKLGALDRETDLTADCLSKAEIGKIIDKINQAGSDEEYKWQKVPESGEIPVGEASDKEVLENNYLIFIRTIDNAGNCAVYVSNGIVIDQATPSIKVNFENGEDSNFRGEISDKNGKNSISTYQGEAKYKLTIEDPEDFFSGISSIEVEVTDNGTSVRGDGEIENLEEDTIYKNSFKYTFEEKEEGYTPKELIEDASLEINGIITADDINSNNVKLKVTAEDKAGNPSTVYEKQLILDNKAPIINIEYDKPNDANSPVSMYYQDSRTMKITYTERNIGFNTTENFEISEEAVPKENIWFEVKREGEQDYSEYSLSELKGLDGVDVQFVKDTYLDKDILDYSKDREIEFEIKFTGQNIYTIVPHCKDSLGNETTATTEKFAIDTEAPEITVSYSYFNASENRFESFKPSENKYKNTEIRVEMTIKEHFFMLEDGFVNNESYLEQMILSLEAENTKSDDETDYQGDYQKIANSEWMPIGDDKWQITFVFNKDANYKMNLTYKDLSGKDVSTGDLEFTYDATPPTGTITVTEDESKSTWEKFFDAVTFNKFSNKDISVEMSGDDLTAGVEKVEAYDLINSPDTMTYDEIKEFKGWTRDGGTEISYSMSPNKQFVPYLKVTDRAGNVEYFSTESGFVADNQEPYVNLSCTNLSEARNGIFNASARNINFAVTAYDRRNETYSGIDKIWYTVQASGNANSTSGPIYVFEADEAKGERIQNEEERNCTFSVPITNAINSNNVIVTAYAQDLAGNTWQDSETVKVDTTAPTINVTYDLNTPSNGKYYNATRTATVTVTERNFDPSGVRFNITNTDGTAPYISGWSHSSSSGVSDSATHTCRVTFAADGDYTFTLNATDLAGNTSNYTRVDEFTIDQTDPTIQVTYDNNNDAEPGYFNAARTATVTINEHNFNVADVNAMITASLQGSGASVPSLGGWSTRGDSHSASVTFSADADYTFDIEYTDMAGNAAADYTQDSFTVDQTAPEIEFFDIEDKSANNGTVAPGVRYSDINYTADGVEITLEGAENGAETVDGTRTSIPNGQSIKMDDFAHEESMDDVYTMTAVITDRAGNKTEESVMFSVNRFGSNYIMSADTEELIEGIYTNEEQELVVTEINVDTLVFNGISYGRDGNLVTLKEGEDYNVSESGSEASWRRYTYTINKENFETEGNYTVTIESEDRAQNVSSTQTKQVQSPTDAKQLYDLNFVVDKTAPTVVITGIEDGGQYRANTREVTVNAADNIAMGEVGVYLGDEDEAAQTYSAEELQSAGGEVLYTLSNSNSRQTVRAVAVDAAGNTAETEISRVLVTSNLFVQFYSNTPLLAGSIAGVVVIAAAIWYFLIFKRKKDEEKKANQQ